MALPRYRAATSHVPMRCRTRIPDPGGRRTHRASSQETAPALAASAVDSTGSWAGWRGRRRASSPMANWRSAWRWRAVSCSARCSRTIWTCGRSGSRAWRRSSHGMQRGKGGERGPFSPGLASTHSIERRPLSTAQGCKDVTSSIIQRAKCHDARIHVAADRNTNMLELNRQPFLRRSISPQNQL
jgi:hypothetical protein